nr:MAG TPA: hypothetical protein [Caudoviricetes sp.]
MTAYKLKPLPKRAIEQVIYLRINKLNSQI